MASFGKFTQNFDYMNLLMFLLGMMLLTTGVIELRKNTKAAAGYLSVFAAMFVLIVGVQSVMLGS
ncbi:DUF3953 domain-containing protein [Alkalihalophilus marmarensis]|uniref:DUF3953 domain-containing protein n=1 Tax=Alkalihalophilus marmarensis DSM 21297 TaxID=1188261 RepID=U6SPK7_9BACI|nr:DUF3953 domain-containing protein [Alkalihalophilus marmarensis]ERN53659.1 hypothetical protein A33I_10660 [Alkalihalophilus marmarensis DSM 21297]